VRNGRQGQGQGSETEDKQTGTKGKREDSETTEKNPLTLPIMFVEWNKDGKEVIRMAEKERVARVTEIIAGSSKGFEDAIKVGFARATKTLRGITGMRVTEFRVAVENTKIVEYRVRLEVIFILEK
jgi:dodecin